MLMCSPLTRRKARFVSVQTREMLFNPDANPYGIRTCRTPDTVIDLGANCGMFSLMARFLYPSARIVAIEPDPDSFVACRINTDHLKIETYRAAICRETGISTMLPGSKRHPAIVQYRKAAPESIDLNAVVGYSLGDLWKACQPKGHIFLKIDMEGAEHAFVGDPAAERCIASCDTVGAEFHAGAGRKGQYESALSVDDYSEWLHRRFDSTHTVTIDVHPRCDPPTGAEVCLVRKLET